MGKLIDIDWEGLTKENREILLSLGFSKPLKTKRRKENLFVDLKKIGIPIKIQRNISCGCCKSITTEYITSYVPKEHAKLETEEITDSVRVCKKCRLVLRSKTKEELIDIILMLNRTFNYN